jgi:ribonuclease P protein subunit POP4
MRREVPRLQGAARDVARGELIGSDVRICAATDPGLAGIRGRIVDETLRTIVLRLEGGREVRVGKAGCVFEVTTPQGAVQLPGRAIEFRPHERIKKVR